MTSCPESSRATTHTHERKGYSQYKHTPAYKKARTHARSRVPSFLFRPTHKGAIIIIITLGSNSSVAFFFPLLILSLSLFIFFPALHARCRASFLDCFTQTHGNQKFTPSHSFLFFSVLSFSLSFFPSASPFSSPVPVLSNPIHSFSLSPSPPFLIFPSFACYGSIRKVIHLWNRL